MNKILSLAFSDFKLIFRDNTLRAFLFLPLILFGFVLIALPAMVAHFEILRPYLPLFIGLMVIENTQMFCFINTMVLIDEKETNVAKLYGVLPLTLGEYILSRFLIPFIFTFLLNVLMLLLQPFYEISIWANLTISFVAAMIVPVYAMCINSFVQNRMQGMVFIKAMNILVILPFAAYFVPQNLKHIFGILPTHWIIQSVDNATLHTSIALFSLIGFLFLLFLTWFMSRLFVNKHFL